MDEQKQDGQIEFVFGGDANLGPYVRCRRGCSNDRMDQPNKKGQGAEAYDEKCHTTPAFMKPEEKQTQREHKYVQVEMHGAQQEECEGVECRPDAF